MAFHCDELGSGGDKIVAIVDPIPANGPSNSFLFNICGQSVTVIRAYVTHLYLGLAECVMKKMVSVHVDMRMPTPCTRR